MLERINAFDIDDIVVASVRRIKPQDVGSYVSLGLRLESGQLETPKPTVPSVNAGKYSRANVVGQEIVRRDLPKTTKSFSWETPNFGNWSKGSHTHTTTREVYQREFIPPKELELSITLLEVSDDGTFVLKFAIDQTLSRKAADFEAELLYNLNLLQENVGSVNVFPSEATLADYQRPFRSTGKFSRQVRLMTCSSGC
jgi:hypothetical protein